MILGLCALTLIGGCNIKGDNHGVAVIDIERVAKETGQSEAINKELDAYKQQLQSKLTEVQTNLTKQINDKKDAIGKKPTEAQREELAQLFGNAKKQYQQAQQTATQNLESKRSQLIISVRDKIRPVARKVANSRGKNVVLVKSDILILDYDTSADITDAVIDEMLITHKDVKVAPPAPAAATDDKSK
jgi:Skp family chaperone for outer membrane proteins